MSARGGAGSAPTFVARGNISAGAAGAMPSVLFEAARHTNLYNPVYQGLAEQTLLAVMRDRSTASGCCASVFNTYNGAVSGASGISLSTDPKLNFTVAMIDSNGFGLNGVTPTRGRPLVVSYLYGPSSFLYINGRLDVASLLDYRAAYSFSLCVGSRNDEGGDRYFDGEVGEILAYNRQLSEQEHADAVSYLMAKWGLA